MRKTVTSVLFLLAMAIVPQVAPAQDNWESEAIRAADEFFWVMDSGDYQGAWQMTSDLHKAKIPREMFVTYRGSIRSSFGKLINRSPVMAMENSAIAKLPDGKYFTLSYETAFENKRKGHEHVHVKLEKDGQWRVAEYQIR